MNELITFLGACSLCFFVASLIFFVNYYFLKDVDLPGIIAYPVAVLLAIFCMFSIPFIFLLVAYRKVFAETAVKLYKEDHQAYEDSRNAQIDRLLKDNSSLREDIQFLRVIRYDKGRADGYREAYLELTGHEP